MSDTSRPMALSRRQVTAGLAAGGALAAGVFGFAVAQDSATPEAGDDRAGKQRGPSDGDDATRLAEHIARIRESMAEVEADRDAVASEIDARTVDDMLSQATSLLDEAEAALESGDTTTIGRQVHGARGLVQAAHLAIVAELTYPGLPSQATRAGSYLATTHDRVTAATDAAADSPTEIGGIVGLAQEMYQQAYDLYEDGAFAQAGAYARVAAELADTGLVLSGASPAGKSGQGRGGSERGGRANGSRGRRGGMNDMPAIGGDDRPVPGEGGDAAPDDVTVPPAPDFIA